jgi:hypothetical protein
MLLSIQSLQVPVWKVTVTVSILLRLLLNVA